MLRLCVCPLLALLAALPCRGATPSSVDLGFNVASNYKELEVGYLPMAWERGPGYLFGSMRVGLGLVVPKGDHPNGVRLHLDTLGSDRGAYLQAGFIVSAGQDLGTGVGARLGVGYRWRQGVRLTVLADGVAGSRKSEGSVGIQAAYTF